MKFDSIIVKDKTGQNVELRSAEISDAKALIEYLKCTAGETPYLIREPEEIVFTEEQEESFIQDKIDSERDLLLLAYTEGNFAGTCSLTSIGNCSRYAHRCNIAIALYKEFFGRGIGKIMLKTVLDVAKQAGYEQAELEVMSENKHAIALYENSGFIKYGTFPDNIKYKDGSYDDTYLMMKKL